MSGADAHCVIMKFYSVRVSTEVVGSADWRARISFGGGFLHPPRWLEDISLCDLAQELHGPAHFSLWYCYADLAVARDERKLRWARTLMRMNGSI